MGERDDVIAQMFVEKSHHGNLSLIYIVQILSIIYSIVLSKNVRDASQVIHLAKQ